MMFEEQNANDNGTGSYCFNEKGNETYEGRTKKEEYNVILENLNKFDVVNYHFRKSTGGATDETNYHFWKIGDWLFAHNGIASSFQQGLECDSLGLFKKLIKKHYLGQNGYINYKRIKKFINDSTFSGRLIIINSKEHKMYFFGDFYAYLINRSYLVITSSRASFENKETIKALGITFETENEIEMEILDASLDGIFYYSFKDGFRELDKKFKEWNYKPYKTDEDKKIEEYYAGIDDEYFGSNEYQEELEKIEAKFDKVVKKIGGNYCNANNQELELAEIEREIEIEALDDRFFGMNVPQKLIACA